MAVRWSPRLAVGVPEIDAQHRELFARVDALLAAMSEGRGRQHLRETFAFLEDYFVEHFRDEVALMRATRYPLAEHHQGLHERFQAELRTLAGEVTAEETPSPLTVVRTGSLCVEWLRNHIGTSDRDFGLYLASREGPASAAR